MAHKIPTIQLSDSFPMSNKLNAPTNIAIIIDIVINPVPILKNTSFNML